MQITPEQMLVLRNNIGEGQLLFVGDFDGSNPQMVGRIDDATPEQMGKTFGKLASMIEFYFMRLRDHMKEDKEAVAELEAYYEKARKDGYSPE